MKPTVGTGAPRRRARSPGQPRRSRAPPSRSDGPGGRARGAPRRRLAVVISGVIMTILDTTIVNVAIHTLGRDFDVSGRDDPVGRARAGGGALAASRAVSAWAWPSPRCSARL